ncbi:uncharacterized protein OCT59_027298 [Rhizophagus irregularis]|uniref:uncharacterized protein n=1 Tax=Rhizophagus irregularis TaxID=588596 RepID=UPI00331C1C50|nr:hypothetical protein OCT59_027298 [Rhizophagus irregularis]
MKGKGKETRRGNGNRKGRGKRRERGNEGKGETKNEGNRERDTTHTPTYIPIKKEPKRRPDLKKRSPIGGRYHVQDYLIEDLREEKANSRETPKKKSSLKLRYWGHIYIIYIIYS